MTFVYPIDEVHGKLKGNFGVAQRVAANNEGERKPYSHIYGKRSTAYKSTELTKQNTFKTNAALVRTRLADITKKAADATAAKAVGMTVRAYLWSLAKAGTLNQQS